MNNLILLMSIIVGLGGSFFSINTIVKTRKKYYTKFLKERKNIKKEHE